LSIASKLLSSEHLTLDQLSSAEQDLWNPYDNGDIYEFLTGEKDSLPEFQFDWITTELTHCFPENWKDFILPKPQDKQPQQPQPVPAQQIQPPQPSPVQPQLIQPPLVQPTPPAAPGCDRVLHNKAQVDYKEVHTGIKRKCKSLRRKAQAMVTKLAPGLFLQGGMEMEMAPRHRHHSSKSTVLHCLCYTNAIFWSRH
jgi:hypothetical protein